MLIRLKSYRIISWLLVFVWMMVIFNFSAQPASQSNSLSEGVTEKVIDTAKQITHINDFNIDNLNHVVRKSAHFLNYLVLAVLVLNALRKEKKLKVRELLFTLLICVLYASSDEIHQLFIQGRGPHIGDVFIDSSGSVLGIVMYWLWISINLHFRKSERVPA